MNQNNRSEAAIRIEVRQVMGRTIGGVKQFNRRRGRRGEEKTEDIVLVHSVQTPLLRSHLHTEIQQTVTNTICITRPGPEWS